MACSVVRSSLLRGSTVRQYAAAAAAQASAAANPEIQVLSNKITVVTIDNNAAIAQVSIVFRAGTRNETYETQGTAHHLRIAAGLSTSRSSGFAITRNIQQLGGTITTTVDRETIAYTLQITRNNLSEALKFLEDVTTRQVFKPWEVSDQLPRLRYELSSIPETTRIVELLHKAAYRTGLGFSLYSPKRQLGKIGSETLQHFVNTWFTGPKCAVVATGVPLSELSAFASNLELGCGESTSEASRYYGGEIRKERNSELATVAVAVEGVSLKNESDALACAILQRAAGTGPRVKWGSSPSPLYRHIAEIARSEPFGLSSFNASYSDSGLFGFVLSSTSGAAGELTKAAVNWLKSCNLSDADITRGKNTLKAEVLGAADNNCSLLESLQQQAILKGAVSTAASIATEIEKVSPSTVKSVASKLAGGALSMAAMGNIGKVPYIDQLK